MSDKLYQWRSNSLFEADGKVYYQSVYSEVESQLFQVGDCVAMLPEEGKLSYIGRIVALYELQDGAKFVQTSWFYRPEETLLGRQPGDGERELFFSDEKAENSVTSVLGLCFVVTLSQFKRGVAYLQQSNPLVEEKNLFFAHKKYDRVAQLLHYLPMYKALGPPVNHVQPGWEVDRVLATMRCQKSDRERLFVRWKDRDPIHCSWIEKEGDERDAKTRRGKGRSGFNMTCDNSSIVEEKSINVHDNLSFDSSEMPDCVEMNIDQPLIVNYGESSEEFQINYESGLLGQPKSNNNTNNNRNFGSVNSLNNNNSNTSTLSIQSSKFGDLGDDTESNQMDIVFPQSLIPSGKLPFASADAAVNFSSAVPQSNSLGANADQFSESVSSSTPKNNISTGGSSSLYLPISIKISAGKYYRKGLGATAAIPGQRKKSGGDRWDITNVVGLSQSGQYVPQRRPYDDVNIPQWHVMTEEEEGFVPDGEGSSDEETSDSAYERLHAEANVRLKEMVTEMLKAQQEHVRLKKQKTEHVQRDREVGSMDDHHEA